MAINNSNTKIAIDTNILIYALESNDERKREIAIELLREKPFISYFVFNELLHVLHKKKNWDKEKTMKLGMQILKLTELMDSSKDTYRYANHFVLKHQFSLYDAIVVADAVLNNCTTLYTEDMNHNQLVDKKTRIINPFK